MNIHRITAAATAVVGAVLTSMDPVGACGVSVKVYVMLRHIRHLTCGLLLSYAVTAGAAEVNPFPVNIRIEAGKPQGPLAASWRFFGADEPNYATMKDGRKLIAELGELRPGDVYFRTHNLLNTGDGTPAFKWGSTNIYTEDAEGRPIYDWRVIDRIFDTYRAHGIRPYAQIGFMPQALSSRPEPYQHAWRPGFDYALISGGWAYPPRDYARWAELVYHWVNHCIERYGRAEVKKWYWEVWNEPDGAAYWHGTPEDFYKLHDYAVDAVRRALPDAQVGGPDTANGSGNFTQGFLDHVVNGRNYVTGRQGTPTDFVSFHAKGHPEIIDGHVRMGIAAHLSAIDRAFALIASVPALKSKPIVIGESDPEGCAACQGPQNGYRNGTVYSSYTAASFARKQELAAEHGVRLEGALTWAFEFEDQPYFAGFRALASNGLDLPVLNVFRMFARMSGQRVPASSSAEVPLGKMLTSGVRDRPDVAAVATRDDRRLSILVWHYHDDDIPGPDAAIDIVANGLDTKAGQAKLTHYRIDDRHSNSFAEWKRLGSPPAPNQKTYEQIEQAGKLAVLAPPERVLVENGRATLHFNLPRQGVSLLELQW
jgi:xylan 1,4-beta-xylosidase